MLHISGLDPDLLARDEIPHMEYGHVLVAREVGAAIMREESEDFTLALELGTEGCSVDPDLLAELRI